MEWDISVEKSSTVANRWYVYVVTFDNKPEDNQRLASVLSGVWTYLFILQSETEVNTFNAKVAQVATDRSLVTFPDFGLFGFCLGRIVYHEGAKPSFETEDYNITTPLRTYDRWAAKAKATNMVGVSKRIPGDLAVTFQVSPTGDAGLAFIRGQLDSEGVERLRNLPEALRAVAEKRILPRIRALAAFDKRQQNAADANQKKADLLQ